MAESAQQRALQGYRMRLAERGLVRFEVLGAAGDRSLIRALARRLSENGAEADRIRTEVKRALAGSPRGKGGILDALRRSPLVGADVAFKRERETGRNVDL